MQAGLTAALGTYVIVLQAGALPLRGWLHVLLATLESRPRAALVGPLVLSPTGAVAQAGGTLYRQVVGRALLCHAYLLGREAG